MNPAPTRAQNNSQNAAFAKGASMAVNNSTASSDNDPATISERRSSSQFRGSSAQPIRKGQRRKFFDEAANHPSIPKSAMSDVTQEAQSVPSQSGVSPTMLRQEHGS